MTVPGDALLEDLDLLQEALRRGEVARVREDVGLRSDQLVGLSQVGGPAMTDHLARDPAGERVAGHSGEGVGPAALEADPELRERLGRARHRARGLEPLTHDLRAFVERGRVVLADRVEAMQHVLERVVVLAHVLFEHRVREDFAAVIHGQARGYVRVHDESGERAQHELEVVGR